MRISDWSSVVCSSDLDLAGVRRGNGREKRTINMLDVDAYRAQVRPLDFTRGTPADAAMRREDDADAPANPAVEGMALDAGEHALFDMLREEAARSAATKPAYRSASSSLRGPCSRRMKSARCARITSSCSSRDNGRSSPPSSNTMPIASSRAASTRREVFKRPRSRSGIIPIYKRY